MPNCRQECFASHEVQPVQDQAGTPRGLALGVPRGLGSRSRRDKASHGWRFAQRTGTHGTAGGRRTGAERAGAPRPLHGASPGAGPRSAPHPLLAAALPHRAALAQEMRRDGSRREPALSPHAGVGSVCRGHLGPPLLHPAQAPRMANSYVAEGGRSCRQIRAARRSKAASNSASPSKISSSQGSTATGGQSSAGGRSFTASFSVVTINSAPAACARRAM